MGKLKLPYFYGHEAEQYAFYRIPKTLISDPRFRNISIDAKLLYGLMLDRMSLSMKNEWIDDLGRVYMQNGYQVPNLLMPQTPEVHLGKYAELRRQYLMKRRRVLYTNLKTSGKLTEHLAEIEQSAQKMVEQTVAQMAQNEGVTEELKATDPLRWTGLMNNLRHSAEELVLNDLIYN